MACTATFCILISVEICCLVGRASVQISTCLSLVSEITLITLRSTINTLFTRHLDSANISAGQLTVYSKR